MEALIELYVIDKFFLIVSVTFRKKDVFVEFNTVTHNVFDTFQQMTESNDQIMK